MIVQQSILFDKISTQFINFFNYALSKTTFCSGILSNVTSTGFSPFKRIAAFNTVPPFSLQ